MRTLLTRLDASIQALYRPEISVDANYTGLDELLLESADEVMANFQLLQGYECPNSFKAGLILSDIIAINWRHNKQVAGEFSLTNLFLSMSRILDESLQDWQFEDIKLSDMRIVDETLLNGGPLYTLILTSQTSLSEQLYLFDTREMFKLELDYQNYLEQVILTKGIIDWQYLFCQDRRLSGLEKATLEKAIQFLEKTFPNHRYQHLWEKWEEKQVNS